MRVLWLAIVILATFRCANAAPEAPHSTPDPMLVRYCYDCHGDGSSDGHFAMDSYKSAQEMAAGKAQWVKAIQYARAHTMPPPKGDQPSEDERDAIVRSIQRAIYHIDPAHPDPGHVVIRRLNSTEYRNTVVELTGITFDPTLDFPQDDTGYGFDNIGDVLSLPPMLLEKYLTAADRVLNVAFGEAAVEPLRHRGATTQTVRPTMSPAVRKLLMTYVASGTSTSTATHSTNAAAARAMLSEFAGRAWRRPVRADELDRLMKLYTLARANAENFQDGVKYAMKAVLVSSSFLFRGEADHESAAASNSEPIGEYELASRLSYFLWSSLPDDELFDLAGRGQLRAHLREQVRRMMASPKFEGFADNFAGQWLQFRNLDAAHPDQNRFKTYNDPLRDAMETETRLFVASIMHDDRSLFDLLTGDYTFVNEQLANHYGLSGVAGSQFRRVSLAGTQRRGVLTQGSVLTLTSNPTRTSPVKRGKWVMENLLATAPPPPPANIPPLFNKGQHITGTVRHQLEKHREDPSCAACHAAMDPIGLAMENFNAVGAWREKDNDGDIDASAAFPNGPKFVGAVELSAILAKTRSNDFLRSAAEHALTFALGRGVEPFDQPAVDKIIADLRANDARFSTLILGVVQSVPFQMKRSDPASQITAAQASTAQ